MLSPFFPTKEPFQLIRASFTVLGKTHLNPIRAKTISYKSITTDHDGIVNYGQSLLRGHKEYTDWRAFTPSSGTCQVLELCPKSPP